MNRPLEELSRNMERARISRRRIITAAAGTAVLALGARRFIDDDATSMARGLTRADGRPRLPPGQRVLTRLKPMGGVPGDPSPGHLRLRVHGAVSTALTLSLPDLLALGAEEHTCDVHCVTGWSVLDATFSGVSIATVLEAAGVLPGATHLILEAPGGFTANVPLSRVMGPENRLAHRLEGLPLETRHGAPLRAVIPDLYFWKSAKWVTGLRVQREDTRGYWEVRGYHNDADPWEEQRYALF